MIDKECPTHGMLMIDLGEAPGEFDPRCLKCEIVRAATAERELVTARAAANTWKEELTRLRAATAAPEVDAQDAARYRCPTCGQYKWADSCVKPQSSEPKEQ